MKTDKELIAELESKLKQYTEIMDALRCLKLDADMIMERMLQEIERGNYNSARTQLNFVDKLLEIK
jgi:hypothetical protein